MATKESLWGSITFNKARGKYWLRGRFQGQQLSFSGFDSVIGWQPLSTRKEAEDLQKFLSNEIANGINILRYKKSTPLRLRIYCQDWLKRIKPTLAYSSYIKYRSAVNNWIIPSLGNVFLPDITYDHYLKLWTEIDREPKTRKNIITTLYVIMEDALRSNKITVLPPKIVFKGKFKIPEKDIEWLDLDTQLRIVDEIEPRDRPIILFTMITGVRTGEARALQKSNLSNIKQGYITVTHTFGALPKGEGLTPVKQKRERRIPYYEALAPVLESLPPTLSPFVFINWRTGRPYTKHITKDTWNPACKKVLGRVVRFYNATRHSWGNQLSEAGIDMERISQGLGHSNTAVTKKHYTNPNLEALKSAVDKVRVIHASKSVQRNKEVK